MTARRGRTVDTRRLKAMPGLPLTDIERLARWEALLRAKNAEIRSLRQAAAEAIVVLRYGHASRAEVAEVLYEATQLAGYPGVPEPVVQQWHEQAREDAASRVAAAVKKCPRCRLVKPLDAFWPDSSARDGRDRWCVACREERRNA